MIEPITTQTTIDVRGVRGQEILRKIRDVVSQYCGRELVTTILLDDGPSLPQVKAFCAMSGCSVKTEKRGDHWAISIKGDACSCR